MGSRKLRIGESPQLHRFPASPFLLSFYPSLFPLSSCRHFPFLLTRPFHFPFMLPFPTAPSSPSASTSLFYPPEILLSLPLSTPPLLLLLIPFPSPIAPYSPFHPSYYISSPSPLPPSLFLHPLSTPCS